ncbi:related to Exosome complex component RRP43 [Saccharomycodes ludwigii]|uniref:Ribosomal RNA-processing protein 43 n=1 Tax=Saccharomycodes ludwigii TaxID=36035 RepID=A0A376B8B0_9ASCO|nr:hypothetical protein SCDLUD_004034 [Saccharomycodes ludwigii]KAH3899748.1 hypothetical protein SCDLUD_004034 [Saccharomycodes ludwigii]SSD60897.1 related to Exosome complex component RRP43 [Saccharomycodes ludwigii]
MNTQEKQNTITTNQPISFPPEVLARIAPDISLQRHLQLGLRPCLRKFEEFREYRTTDGELSNKNNPCVLGSNISRLGEMFVITTITGGIIEENMPVTEIDTVKDEIPDFEENTKGEVGFASVYPIVQVERGRVGAPTDEEMIVSQKLCESILNSQLITNNSLSINSIGIRNAETQEIVYDSQKEQNERKLLNNRKWSYVLYSKQQVFSRNSPIFELCLNSLVLALKTVKLPRAYIDERAIDLKIPIRTRGRSANIRESYDLNFDINERVPLTLNIANIGFASNFGVIKVENSNEDPILLADLESEAEESSILSRISIISTPTNKGSATTNFKSIYMAASGDNVPMHLLKRALEISCERTNDLYKKLSK